MEKKSPLKTVNPIVAAMERLQISWGKKAYEDNRSSCSQFTAGMAWRLPGWKKQSSISDVWERMGCAKQIMRYFAL